MTSSPVHAGAYIVSLPVGSVAEPAFTPEAGTFSSSVDVAITCATAGATIRYTIDGTDPTEASAVYSTAIHVVSDTTLKARAFKTGLTASPIHAGAYRMSDSESGTVAEPSFAPGGGSFDKATDVTVACSTPGAAIRYTTDGTEPTESSSLYSAAIHIASDTTLKARAFKTGMTQSPVHSASYNIRTLFGVGRPALSRSKPRVGRTFTVSGKFDTAHVGRSKVSVQFQRWNGRRYVEWKLVSFAIGNGAKAFSVKTSLRSTGIYRVRVVHSCADHLSSVSRWVGFTVVK